MRRQTTYGNNHDDVGAAEEAKALITKRKFSTEEHKKSTVTCASSFNCVFFLLWLFSSHEIDVLRDSKSPPKLQSLLLSRVAFSIFCGEMNQFSIGTTHLAAKRLLCHLQTGGFVSILKLAFHDLVFVQLDLNFLKSIHQLSISTFPL